MSNYTFTFKKSDIVAEFTTTDKLAVERQFPLWVASASEAAKKKPQSKPQVEELTQNQAEEKKTPDPAPAVIEKQPEPVVEPVVAEIVVEENLTEDKFVEEQHVEPEIFVEPEATLTEEQPAEVVLEVQSEEIQPEEVEPEEVEPEANSQVFDKASTLLKTINTIQTPPEEEPAEETVDFGKVLEESIENPTFEPNQTKDERFLKVIASKNTSDRFHYLIITAYYLLEYEKMQRFSLKQINAKLMNNLSRVVDHTILREAINEEFVEVVPDLTGASETAEYRLTEKGEDFFLHGIN